ncbi:lysophospholipid acyltransferase family protein [Caldalkalibacillus salinus]|uniref:lysophospholipid acyltransferase family protein n=1 Tax=Caldalkalibacillus salinus TaxID=2803787 RepID=UPI0019237D5A|nr:lysophospholipid acyltransferase family protein [Caldalkalibacillus salinus]
MYRWGKPILGGLLKLYHRIEVVGSERIPTSPGYVLVANHQNYLDPFLVGAVLPHQPFFMAKEEAFHHWFLGPVLRGFEAIPVKRKERDIQAIKHGIQVLREDKVLGIFPEGGRRQHKDFQDLKLGACYFSHKTSKAIIPMYIDGSERALPQVNGLPRPAKVKVLVAEPIHPEGFDSHREMSGVLHDALVNLKDQAQFSS